MTVLRQFKIYIIDNTIIYYYDGILWYKHDAWLLVGCLGLTAPKQPPVSPTVLCSSTIRTTQSVGPTRLLASNQPLQASIPLLPMKLMCEAFATPITLRQYYNSPSSFFVELQIFQIQTVYFSPQKWSEVNLKKRKTTTSFRATQTCTAESLLSSLVLSTGKRSEADLPARHDG